MKKRSSAGLNVGGSSIMMIFVLLCLTTFATLSVVSANADLNLTQKAFDSTTIYYAADGLAEQKLAQIDSVLAHVPAGEESTESAMQALRDQVEGLEFSLLDDSFLVNYAVPMAEDQELRVSLKVSPSGNKLEYSLQEWSVYSTGEWDVDSGSLNLWDGGLFDDSPVFELPDFDNLGEEDGDSSQ